uniref:Uncharacterized protein n=1 Tax=Lactuca sativa TaxID=4236 RepID=A0A9R1XN41_LACSA|nr:hypothetical protein LSAT_V11C400169820 [Lactuca sativa]
MNITQITSVMVVSSSPVSRRPWVVGCCMQQYSSSPLRKVTSHSQQANPSVMNLDMTKERIRKLRAGPNLLWAQGKKKKWALE